MMPVMDQIPAGAAAAVSGGIVGALIVRGPFIDRVAAGVTGASFAWYVAPVFAPFVYAGLESLDKMLLGNVVTLQREAVFSFTGFLLGTTGLAVPSALYALVGAIKARLAKRISKL